MILAFLAVICVGVLPYILGTFYYVRDPDYGKRFTAAEWLVQRYLRAITAIVVVLLAAWGQPGGIPLVGLGAKNGVPTLTAILIGMVVLALVVILYAAIWKIVTRRNTTKQSINTSRSDIANILRYQNRWERSAFLTTLTTEVIAEDLVYRGYLVLLLGQVTGNFIPWIVFSLALSILIHLYQGRKLQIALAHLIMAGVFIGLAVYTQNLIAAIAPHLYYDIIWAIQTWKLSDQEAQARSAVTLSVAKKAAYIVFVGANVLGAIIALCLLF